jgi:hypothetical protein
MTLAEYAPYIGRTALLQDVLEKGFTVAVRILDVRSSFGRIDVKVTPIVGSGDTWVNITRVVVKE